MSFDKLPKVEISFYFFTWFGAIIYGSYNVYLGGKTADLPKIYFSEGWLGYKKDTCDSEWNYSLPFLLRLFPTWILTHVFLTELTRRTLPQAVPVIHCFITWGVLLLHFGTECLVFLLLEAILFFSTLQFQSTFIFLLAAMIIASCSTYALEELWLHTDITWPSLYLMEGCVMWQFLRCACFCLDVLSSKQTNNFTTSNFFKFLGFVFYLPTFFTGPLILYSNFGCRMYNPSPQLTCKRISVLIANVVRYLFWVAVLEVFLHVFHIHALAQHFPEGAKLGSWFTYGLGILIGQFFCMKYKVLYGLTTTVAKFEGYLTPPPPKCILHLHLYTDLWRVFDVGFYQFMHKYIYRRLCNRESKIAHRLGAAGVCFCFVVLWHSFHLNVVIWCSINFVIVCFVAVGSTLSKTAAFENWKVQSLSQSNCRRLRAISETPLFILGSFSSIYFLSGTAAGNTLFNQLLFNGSWTSVACGFFISYCMCQVSIEIRNWEDKQSESEKLKEHDQ